MDCKRDAEAVQDAGLQLRARALRDSDDFVVGQDDWRRRAVKSGRGAILRVAVTPTLERAPHKRVIIGRSTRLSRIRSWGTGCKSLESGVSMFAILERAFENDERCPQASRVVCG